MNNKWLRVMVLVMLVLVSALVLRNATAVLAHGTDPVPPTPWLTAHGTDPVPPTPWNVAHGTDPVPPTPWNVAHGTDPVPPTPWKR